MRISPATIKAGADALAQTFPPKIVGDEVLLHDTARNCFEAMIAAIEAESVIPPHPRKEAPRT